MLFIAVGAVAATGATSGLITAFVVVALVIAVVLALLGWGVMRSVRLELDGRRIDAAIEEAIAATGSSLTDLTCGCGHDHNPDELHVTDDPCSHDGQGHQCSQTCDTCVFSRLQATADAERIETDAVRTTTGAATGGAHARRPQPGPRRPQPTRR